MVLAHTLGAGGPDFEMLMIAGALVVLGIVFFFQRSVKPMTAFVLLVVGVGVGSGAFFVGAQTGNAGPSRAGVIINSPSDGITVPANTDIPFDVSVRGGTLATEQGPNSGGHLHVYVDGTLDSMPSGGPPVVNLTPGKHVITIEYVGPKHVSFSPPVQTDVSVTAKD